MLKSAIITPQYSILIDVNGGWSNWGSYGECSATCGKGLKYRTRSCTSPKPSGSGSYCTGISYNTTECTLSACPRKSYNVIVEMNQIPFIANMFRILASCKDSEILNIVGCITNTDCPVHLPYCDNGTCSGKKCVNLILFLNIQADFLPAVHSRKTTFKIVFKNII